MPDGLKSQGVPGDRGRASGQKKSDESVTRALEDKAKRLRGKSRFPCRPGRRGPARGGGAPCGRGPPRRRRGRHEIIIGASGKGFTQIGLPVLM